MTLKLDSADLKLLRLIQQDARQPAEVLGEKVGLSTPAAHRRLKRLRDNGIIKKEIAVLDDKKLGYPMTFIIALEVERERIDLMDSLKKELSSLPQVQQCFYVTGEVDFYLIVKTRDMEDYMEFTKLAFFGNTNIRKFRTSVVMNQIKLSLDVPVGN